MFRRLEAYIIAIQAIGAEKIQTSEISETHKGYIAKSMFSKLIRTLGPTFCALVEARENNCTWATHWSALLAHSVP